MIVEFDAADEAFREEVRQFLREHLPEDMAWRVRTRGFYGGHRDVMAWSRILHRKGWAVPHWPMEQGGTGWSATRQQIFHEEMKRGHAPSLPYQGPYLVGPVLMAVGSARQKERFLPRIRSGEDCWCQGFSEPGAGSDLASLRTRAIRQGDHYMVNGQKLWTSAAHQADWGFFLVRTDPQVRPQEGISFLLIDMKSPGIQVRPVILLNGEHHVNEVFFEDVAVPAENLVGEENQGWLYARTLLGAERSVSAEVYWTENEIEKLKDIARRETASGKPMIEDEVFRNKLARLEIDALALRYSVLRVYAEESNKFHEGAVSSALKLRGSELLQRVAELQVEVLGPKAIRYFDAASLPDSPQGFAGDSLWPDYAIARTGTHLSLRAATIAGGAKEVQKNIIAKLAFGL